jgi:hypothetical protein
MNSRSDCEGLRQLATKQYSSLGPDSLYVFLSIHHCICSRIETGEFPVTLKGLNADFVHRCEQVYLNFQGGRTSPRDLSDNWVLAFEAYCDHAHWYLWVLPRMARAHILDDLPECLYATDITKFEYDLVFTVILECLENVVGSLSGRTAAEKISFLVINSRPAHRRLEGLREQAWNKILRRRALAARVARLVQ